MLYYVLLFLVSLPYKGKYRLIKCLACECVPPFSSLNQWTDFHEIWCERYVIGRPSNSIISDSLQAVIATWRTHELVRFKRRKRIFFAACKTKT